jgi:Asp-tRNA(Asn)/Glu-tRNA(Gln) amidotransferase A subunit family amidase
VVLTDITALTACALARRLRSGDVSAEAVAVAYLERFDAREPLVHAWAHVDREAVLAQARDLDRGPVRGPLHGLPIGIKDTISTRDLPTQYNSPAYRSSRPGIDASCVSILRSAGALIFGKTATVEFASNGRVPPTRNPHDLGRTPGGSSSGSAAAVADRQIPLAIGTQTGGSIIRPASFCGVHAMKPTWGLASFEGAKSSAPSLDTLGWFGRSVDDLVLLYEVFAGETGSTPATDRERQIDSGQMRLAVCRSPAWDFADEATRAALADAQRRLAAAGLRVDELELPGVFHRALDTHARIMFGEGRASFLCEFRADPSLLHDNLRSQVESRVPRDELRRAYDAAARYRESFDSLADAYDAILTPSAVGEALVGLEHTGSFVFNALWTLLHAPCVNLPVASGPAGLPVGLSLVGRRFADRRLLSAAVQIQRILE